MASCSFAPAQRCMQRPAVQRSRVVRVQAKVVRPEGAPRVVKGKCYVTKDVRARIPPSQQLYGARQSIYIAIGLQNIDTDQIIPAEYLTLVPSKVGCSRSCSCVNCSSRRHQPLTSTHMDLHCSRMSMRSWAAML
jgi:hypothetical protein